MSCNTTLTLRTDPIEEHLDDIGTTFFSAPSYSVQPTHLRDDMFLQLIIRPLLIFSVLSETVSDKKPSTKK